MYRIKTMNKIASAGLDQLDKSRFQVGEDVENEDGILVRSAKMHDYVFPDALRAIARAGAGTNNIPIDRCSESGIVVFNTPGANANAVKELVIAALLIASRDIVGGVDWVQEQAHTPNVDVAAAVEKGKSAFVGPELYRKTLGVIGLGAIGALVCNIGLDLGMDVYGYDPYVSVGAAWRISSAVHHVTNLDDLFRTCDYLTIHVPAMEGTIGMVGGRACSLMKDGAVVLNFSRDTLVDNAAMASALASGKVGAYITDFATPEVMKMEHAIVLPHLGASTAEAEDNCAAMAVQEMMDYLENGNIKNSVNFPACDMGACPAGMSRAAVMHENIPSMISRITDVFGEEGVNIENMTNKSRGDAAYTMLDLDQPVPATAVEKLEALEGVRRVRVVC